MNKNSQSPTTCTSDRRGSTLVIVIALLGLLAFTGVVFFTFASSERQAAEYFSEAAKGEVDAPDNVWDHPLRQIISGPGNHPSERGSITRSPSRRHAITTNLVGGDLSPHSGEGVHLIMEDDPSTADPTAVPRVDMTHDGTANDEDGNPAGETNNQPLLNFVDSPSVWMGNETRTSKVPAPDVDYTSPDINNLFLAYKGWAVRDNGPGANPQFERVPIIIPSFFRPQYLKTGGSNGFGGNSTPTNINWAYEGMNPDTNDFAQRSFRPNLKHIAGFMPDGTTPVYRYLTAAEATSFGITSGAFPFVPADNALGKPGGMNGYRGELGVWTGSDPEAYELDADPDGDGIREGIWIDTHYPVQEHVDSSGTTRLYVVLHSFTIYDLDGLIDLNVHGNLAGLDRSGNLRTIAASGVLNSFSISRSNHGLGPNEINPIWALRKSLASGVPADVARQFNYAYGQLPNSPLEQANMEWIWLLSGRAQLDAANKLEDIFTGRWGEAERVFNTYGSAGSFQVWDLPRPGASGDAQQVLSSGIRFGGPMFGNGRNGFDDNQDAMDGEIAPGLGRIRPFGTPMDYAGTGRIIDGRVTGYVSAGPGSGTFVLAGDPRVPILHHNVASTGPERFQAFNGYSMTRDINTVNSRYVFGQNGTFDNAAGDDLIANPNLDAPFEDALESVFDAEISQKNFDAVFGPQDTPALHLTDADIKSAPDTPSERMLKLAPYALDKGNASFSFYEQATPGVRSRFTTVSNSLHRFMMRSPFGADGRPGDAGIDDDGDGIIDEPDEVLATYRDSDTLHRFREFSADTDGNDRDGDGFPDGDGFYEFPPAFGATVTAGKPYSGTDPFRPQVRRLLTMESGEGRGLFGQMPLSINHILDVERNNQTPADGTPEFLYYMQRAGMRFRPLIDHPSATEGAAITGATVIPTTSAASPVLFPPTTPEQREFWARRDRQKLARDIYGLLYTTGGAGINAAGTSILDYTAVNDPSLAEGTSLYTHAQLRRMAQFAVNLVDAMDSDNVITKFEYDKNFGNGWNMDDDAYAPLAVNASLGYSEDAPSANAIVTGNGLYSEDGLERGVVYGVEAQELAFSEVLAATSQKFPTGYTDSQQTKHSDLTDDTNFLQIELQNVRPTPVDMALTGATGTGNEDFGIWQLARFDRAAPLTSTSPQVVLPTQRVTFMEGNASISGGNRFTVAMAGNTSGPAVADPTGWGTADLYVNYDSDPGMTFELVAPDIAAPGLTTGGTAALPRCDLDLIYPAQNTRWLNAGNNRTNFGQFIDSLKIYAGNNDFNFASTGNKGFDLVLRRRANPNMPHLPLAENPWIEVDRHSVSFQEFFIDGPMPMTKVADLTKTTSHERREPLDAANSTQYPVSQMTDPSPLPYRFNTIGSELNLATNNGGGSFDLMQIHYDREYASSAELLQLPVVGPNLLTHRLNRMRYAPYQQVSDSPTAVTNPPAVQTTNISSAEAMVLQPDFPNGTETSIMINSARDNRWYRLFQFVEVPSRVHRMLGNYLTLQRIPGKLNVNMIRHREVLAGLIDNPLFADVPPLLDKAPTNNEEDSPFMTSSLQFGGTALQPRDAWIDLIKDRDGRSVKSFNPTTGTSPDFWLPATPYANPFRSYGFQGSTLAQDNGIDQTPLRHMLQDRIDNVPETNRHWLEVGSTAFHKLPGDLNEPVDGSEERRFAAVSQRHQILSKILNNTTTVSNCFIAYGVAAYFEAYEEPTTGLIRVGGRYDLDQDGDATNDEQRAVFIIDRTEAFNAYDPGTGDFDWKRLVKNQVIIK